MERRYDTLESRRLMDGVLNGSEWESWDLQLQRLEKTLSVKGRQDIRIKSERRAIIATVYVSRKFSVIYVLGYHIVRKGEPTENQRARVNDYVAEITKLEHA